MSGALEWFRALYPVLVTIVSLISFGLFLWLATKFVSRADHDKALIRIAELETMRARHDSRLRLVEQHVETSPTRQELQDDISALAGRIAAMEASISGLSERLRTTNDYLHTLIEKRLS